MLHSENCVLLHVGVRSIFRDMSLGSKTEKLLLEINLA